MYIAREYAVYVLVCFTSTYTSYVFTCLIHISSLYTSVYLYTLNILYTHIILLCTIQNVLEETTGQDLAKMLWLKSKTADAWVERRSNFTLSMAVMSVVGYILGLGDRHPSNLMIDRVTGRWVHILYVYVCLRCVAYCLLYTAYSKNIRVLAVLILT